MFNSWLLLSLRLSNVNCVFKANLSKDNKGLAQPGVMITVISKQTVLHRVGGDPLALEGISQERFLSHALPLSRPIKPGSLKVPTWLWYCCYCSLTNIFPEVWHTNSKMTNHKRQHTYHNQQPDQETKYYQHPGPSLCTPSSHRPAILL